MSDDRVLVLECPTCGRLWVGVDFSEQEQKEIREYGRHAPAIFLDDTYAGHNAGLRTCYGVPESVHRSDVQAAWLVGGKESAQACVNGSLRDAIEDYERTTRTRQ